MITAMNIYCNGTMIQESNPSGWQLFKFRVYNSATALCRFSNLKPPIVLVFLLTGAKFSTLITLQQLRHLTEQSFTHKQTAYQVLKMKRSLSLLLTKVWCSRNAVEYTSPIISFGFFIRKKSLL